MNILDCTLFLRRLVSSLFCLVLAGNLLASDFGTTGLITLPSAKMQLDGSLTATLSRNEVVDIYNVTFQATPYVEATFRYAIFNPREQFGSTDVLRDRSYEVKVSLMKEGAKLPALAIGVRDLLGTGVWSGEYLVATKGWKLIEATMGLGWGRYAGRGGFSNPLSILSENFEDRPTGFIGEEVGGFSTKAFFRGPVGIFGGLKVSVPRVPLKFAVEYSSDIYQREARFGSIGDSSPVNIGMEWTFKEGVMLAAAYQQKQFLSLTLKAALDAKNKPKRQYERFYSSADQLGRVEAPEQIDLAKWYDKLLFDAERSGLRVHAAHFRPGDDQISFTLSNDRYALWADALNQFYVLSEIHLPENFERIAIAPLEDNLAGSSVLYDRSQISEKAKLVGVPPRKVTQRQVERVRVQPALSLDRPIYRTNFGYPRLALGADLAMRVQLMDPNEPLKHQLYVKGTGRLAISEAFNIWSAVTVDISNDFNTVRPSNSVLPRVRSEINQYLTQGRNGVDTMFGEYRQSFDSEIHLRAYIGILEEMFGGIGAELLFEPFAARWALGINLNWVRQRDFDKRFGFQDFQVLTGHASLFYASPFYNFDFGLHIGRYLAADKGYTVEARRTFDNGFAIGAFFTRTNVSSEDFGEGSFDKGMFFSMPYSFFIKGNNRSKYNTVVRAIERDGGRRLEGAVGNLWWDRRALRYDALQNNRDRVVL